MRGKPPMHISQLGSAARGTDEGERGRIRLYNIMNGFTYTNKTSKTTLLDLNISQNALIIISTKSRKNGK